MRSGLALLSIVALVCVSLEIELLQQIDSLRLYLTNREIALDAAAALLVSIAGGVCWWLLVLVIGKAAGALLPSRQFRVHLLWDFWIGVPFAYLALEIFQDFKLEFFSHWHAGTNVQILVALALTCACIVAFILSGWPVLQEFCRTRLVPVAWFHIALAVVAAAALWLHGVRLFRDFADPGSATVVQHAPDIYLVTMDALRADDMSVYGYSRPTTPNLEKFAQRSFVFDYYFANSNFTTPSTSSIETGKLPWAHRVFQAGGFLRGKNQQETLAALLKQQGYYTAMISSNALAAPFRHRTLGSYNAVEYAYPKGVSGFRFRASNLLGLNTQCTFAFSLMRAQNIVGVYLDRLFLGDQYPSPAEDVFGRATRLLEQHTSPQPLFLWLHVFPPHDPYWVPPAYRHRFVQEPVQSYDKFAVPDTQRLAHGVTVQELHNAYDEMIVYADHSVGEFLAWLDQTGRLDRSIVIVSADHGEMFEHNRLAHGGPALYNGVIHVPLLIHLPGQKTSARVEQLSQQVDLLPTLLDLVGAPPPAWGDGVSLKPALEANKLPDHYVFSMNLEPNRIFDPVTRGSVAVLDDNFKFVRHLESGTEQLYKYRTDEGEDHSLIESQPEVAARMRQVLLNKIAEINRNGAQW